MPVRNDGKVIKILNDAALSIVEQAKENASWSDTIPYAISYRSAEVTNDGYQVAIVLDASPDGPAPHAAAFEFGSGIHATRKKKGTYRIEPKNKQVLAFPTERWENFNYPVEHGPAMLGISYQNKFLLRYVDHPGVEQNAFVTPAIIEKLPEVEALINQAVRVILNSGNKVEVIR